MEVSTTNPVPPTGLTPTEVPFGISGSTSETPAPINIKYSDIEAFNIGEGFYLNSFTVSSTMAPGAKLFEFAADYPTGESMANNLYVRSLGTNGVFRPVVPWSLSIPYFSRQCKIDWELRFIPVKVADARASLDFVVTYEHTASSVYNYSTLTNDSFHKNLDDQDDQFQIRVPMIWLTNLPLTMGTRMAGTSLTNIQPNYLPKTRVQVFVRSPYQPNLMQPTDFEVHVVAFPIVRQTQTIAGKSIIEVFSPELDELIPTPYFFQYKT